MSRSWSMSAFSIVFHQPLLLNIRSLWFDSTNLPFSFTNTLIGQSQQRLVEYNRKGRHRSRRRHGFYSGKPWTQLAVPGKCGETSHDVCRWFDKNGSIEQVICTYNGEKSYPMALRHDLITQLPTWKKNTWSMKVIKIRRSTDIFTEEQLKDAIRWRHLIFPLVSPSTMEKESLP